MCASSTLGDGDFRVTWVVDNVFHFGKCYKTNFSILQDAAREAFAEAANSHKNVRYAAIEPTGAVSPVSWEQLVCR